jgi:hypothetical protein
LATPDLTGRVSKRWCRAWPTAGPNAAASRRHCSKRPAVLTDGRSPAPRVVGNLLIALCNVGAAGISAPVCAECGKQLRTLQRRGQDWYCGVHGPETEACTGCGNIRPVAIRDRRQRPHCWECPLSDEHDPIHVVIDLVAKVDPALPVEVVTASICSAAPQAGNAADWHGPCRIDQNCSPEPAPKPQSPRC